MQTLTTKQRDEQSGQSWYDRPHDELVAAFRDYIDRARDSPAGTRRHMSPMRDHIVEARLGNECSATDDPETATPGRFFLSNI